MTVNEPLIVIGIARLVFPPLSRPEEPPNNVLKVIPPVVQPDAVIPDINVMLAYTVRTYVLPAKAGV